MNEDKNTFKPADFSDAGNAAVFVREHCDDIIFTDSMGWLCWDGKRWERNEHKALELAEDFSEHMLRDAMGEYRERCTTKLEAKAADPEGSEAVKAASEAVKRSKAYLAHANMTRRVSRLKAILDLARPYMVRPGNSMDADPLELNTQAGIINLVTGAFRLPAEHIARKLPLSAGMIRARYLGFFSGYDHLREQQPKRIPSDGCRYVALWQGLSGGRYLCRWHR